MLGILIMVLGRYPGHQKYVKPWPFGLFILVSGNDFTFFGGPGTLHLATWSPN